MIAYDEIGRGDGHEEVYLIAADGSCFGDSGSWGAELARDGFPFQFIRSCLGFVVFFEILLQERWLCHVVSCDTLCFAAKLFAFSWRTAFIYFWGY